MTSRDHPPSPRRAREAEPPRRSPGTPPPQALSDASRAGVPPTDALVDDSQAGMPQGPPQSVWRTRPERPEDAAALRDLLLAAFPTSEEADLVEALRRDADAWIEGPSWIAHADAPSRSDAGARACADAAADEDLGPVAHALLTRAHVDGEPVLALAPCATLPARQRRGAGSAAIRAALGAAREAGENCVIVLGHADYYPRFGFAPASRYGIGAPFDVPDEAFMALALDPDRPLPRGRITYPPAFGI